MKLNKFSTLAISTTLATASLAMVPGVASAETSATLTLSNMYLWRGVNLTPDGPAISGSLDYANESGFYTGVWATNETGGHETDLYAGFAGEAGAVSYDVSYWYYLYPEDVSGAGSRDLTDNDLSEVVIGLGVGDFGAGLYISADTLEPTGSDYVYYTLDYTAGPVNLLYGAWTYDDAGNDEYSHVTVTYSYNDDLSFGISVAQDDIPDNVETDPLFVVTYNVPIK